MPPSGTLNLTLLPGFDGTGIFFKPFIDAFAEHLPTKVLTLPSAGTQDYESLSEAISEEITDNTILLAESFSGPLAVKLAHEIPQSITGLILSTSFLRSPLPNALLQFASIMMPMRNYVPLRQTIIRHLLCDTDNTSLAEQVDALLLKLDTRLLQQRMEAVMHSNVISEFEKLSMPVLLIHAQNDRLLMERISPNKNSYRSQSQTLSGPHLLLQNRPKEASELVRQFIEQIRETRSTR